MLQEITFFTANPKITEIILLDQKIEINVPENISMKNEFSSELEESAKKILKVWQQEDLLQIIFTEKREQLSVVDLGSGRADVVIVLLALAKKYGFQLRYMGIDCDQATIQITQHIYSQYKDQVQFVHADASDPKTLETKHPSLKESCADLVLGLHLYVHEHFAKTIFELNNVFNHRAIVWPVIDMITFTAPYLIEKEKGLFYFSCYKPVEKRIVKAVVEPMVTSNNWAKEEKFSSDHTLCSHYNPQYKRTTKNELEEKIVKSTKENALIYESWTRTSSIKVEI